MFPSFQHLDKNKASVCLCAVTPVFITVCGDHMVSCVSQLMAFKAPGDVWLWISHYSNFQGQTLAGADIKDAAVCGH